MNRRSFVARAAAILSGIAAACVSRPELVYGQGKKEPRIIDVLREEVARVRASAPKDLLIAGPYAMAAEALRFRVDLSRVMGTLRPSSLGPELRGQDIDLYVDPLATVEDIRKQFTAEYAKAIASLYPCAVCKSEEPFVPFMPIRGMVFCPTCVGIYNTLYPHARLDAEKLTHVRELRKQGYLHVLSPKVAEDWSGVDIVSARVVGNRGYKIYNFTES